MNDAIQPRLKFGSELLPPEFWAQVKVQRNGCWHWTGKLSTSGYGIFGKKRAHRLTYAVVAEIPKGFVVDHLCHKPSKCKLGRQCPHRRCCNPEHLEAVTNEENVRRGNWHLLRQPKTKTGFSQCPRGHWRLTGAGCYECVRAKRAAMMREVAERREAFRNRPMPNL